VIRRLVLAALLLAAAAVLLLFARDAWHWQRAMRDADTRAAVCFVQPRAWNADTTLPPGLVRGILAVDDDVTFRQLMSRALLAQAHQPTSEARRGRSILESALARLTRDDPSAARAASAADELGVLLYFDPPTPSNAKNPYQNPNQAAPSGAQTPSQKALAQFELAVRLDPGNATAQRNLETLLRASQKSKKQQTPRAGAGDRFGTKGSGARLPGHGY
jgi:hypothetical protein